MREKRVWRYWCDYCKKAGLQKAAMRRHESHCTLNPNRECGMCGIYDMEQKPITELIEVLKGVADNWKSDDWGETFSPDSVEMKAAMKALDEVTGGCPACKLAAIRQSKIPVPCTDFDFKEECRKWWIPHNEERAANYSYGY